MTFVRKWLMPTHQYIEGRRVNLVEYDTWHSIMRRCRIGAKDLKVVSAYSGCSYSLEWGSYDVYLDWARVQVGYLLKDSKGHAYTLDKDILCEGNRLYCPELCVFVPREVNNFFILRPRERGNYPVGVYRIKESLKYIAHCRTESGSRRYLGVFNTPELAFQAYKIAKEGYAKQLAIKYTGLVDPRVIAALNNYKVDIDD